LGQHWLWRPLLDVSRADLSTYALQHGLTWIEDPSNASTDPDRNFLRHRVLPQLRERWPHADEALSRSAALHAESSELLDADDACALADCATIDTNVVSIDALLALPQSRRARVLRRWISGLGLPPLPAQGVANIESELLNGRVDASPEFRWRGVIVRRSRDVLHVDSQRVSLPDDCRLQWNGDHELRLPTGDRLQLITNGVTTPAFETAVSVHARRGGERIALPGRSHSHALKHVLQDLGIPRWEREAMPLLSTPDGELLAAGDLAYSGVFDDWLRRNRCRLRWTRDPARAMP
ncbi:MAG: tRNA lysidine(34) synthetase TilS, partial [Luteimonas sp.]